MTSLSQPSPRKVLVLPSVRPELSMTNDERPTERWLPATCLKTQILTEKREHVILKAIGDLARVRALVHFETVRDSVLIKNIVQLGSIDA